MSENNDTVINLVASLYTSHPNIVSVAGQPVLFNSYISYNTNPLNECVTAKRRH